MDYGGTIMTVQNTMNKKDRMALAVQLGERIGQGLHWGDVLEDKKYVYQFDADYPDEVSLYQKPLPWCAEIYDCIPYDQSPFCK